MRLKSALCFLLTLSGVCSAFSQGKILVIDDASLFRFHNTPLSEEREIISKVLMQSPSGERVVRFNIEFTAKPLLVFPVRPSSRLSVLNLVTCTVIPEGDPVQVLDTTRYQVLTVSQIEQDALLRLSEADKNDAFSYPYNYLRPDDYSVAIKRKDGKIMLIPGKTVIEYFNICAYPVFFPNQNTPYELNISTPVPFVKSELSNFVKKGLQAGREYEQALAKDLGWRIYYCGEDSLGSGVLAHKYFTVTPYMMTDYKYFVADYSIGPSSDFTYLPGFGIISTNFPHKDLKDEQAFSSFYSFKHLNDTFTYYLPKEINGLAFEKFLKEYSEQPRSRRGRM